ALCAEAARVGWRVYFHGGASGVAAALAEEMRRRHPGLVVAGADSPPFRPLTGEEDAALVEAINGSEADLVFVGLGCPKQETWMADHRGRLAAPVLLGVGAAFDFHTGRVRQAPRWMMAAGLEWLFRWSQEPRRLGRRKTSTPSFPPFTSTAVPSLECHARPRAGSSRSRPTPSSASSRASANRTIARSRSCTAAPAASWSAAWARAASSARRSRPPSPRPARLRCASIPRRRPTATWGGS